MLEEMMPIKPILEEDVLIKGSSNGILIVLNLSQDYEKLIKKLVQKVKKDKKFLSGTKLFVKGTDRNLDKDELGMARKMVMDKTGLELFSPDLAHFPEQDTGVPIVPESNKPDIISHTLRAGESITSLHDIVIFGDINPGANVTTKGSLYVYGKIRGSVHAGNDGNREAIVSCHGFSPIQFKIADCTLSPEIDISELLTCACTIEIDRQEIKLMPYKKD
jgi:septum site-determining protein MinC